MNQLLYFSPVIVFALHLLSSFVRPWTSRELKAMRKFKESMKKDEDKSVRLLMYTTMERQLKKEISETEDESEKGVLTEKLTDLESEKEGVMSGVKSERDKVVKEINKVIRMKSIYAVSATFLSILLTNIGFLIIMFTGSYIGVLVSLVTFVGTAILTDVTLSNDKEFQKITNNSTFKTTVYSILSSTLAHLPFFLALFLWM